LNKIFQRIFRTCYSFLIVHSAQILFSLTYHSLKNYPLLSLVFMTSFVSHYKLWYIIYENPLISPGQIFHVYCGIFFLCISGRNSVRYHHTKSRSPSCILTYHEIRIEELLPTPFQEFPAMQSSSDMEETELRPHNKVLRHYKTFSGETLGLSLRKIERTLAVSFPCVRKVTGNRRRRRDIRSRVSLTRFQIIM